MATRVTKTIEEKKNKKSAGKVAKEIKNTQIQEQQEEIQTLEEIENFAENKEQTIPVNKRKNIRAVAYTWDGHPLTEQESNFIEEYCITGNGRQSYIKAYPNSNPSNAAQNANRLLNKEYIASEINHRAEESRTNSIATAQEIMQYFTDVMQGKIKDAFGLEASLAERTKAAVELAKRQIDIPQKMANNDPPEIKITLDFAKPDNLKTVAEVLGTTSTDVENIIDDVNKEESGE